MRRGDYHYEVLTQRFQSNKFKNLISKLDVRRLDICHARF
jgi:hypothetical protein